MRRSKQRNSLLAALLICLLTSVHIAVPAAKCAKPLPIAHDMLHALLQEYVSASGKVDYKGLKSDTAALNEYLDLVSSNPPTSAWSRNEKLAYWINAYNAFTLKLIVDNYPLTSIQDLHPALKIPTINTVWHKEFFQIGGQTMSLDAIEHKILRREFEEPRIHFAINCASKSCPQLQNEAFTAQALEEQLTKATEQFINDESRNQLGENKIRVSKIFRWFKKDFTKQGSLVSFLQQYTEVEISQQASIEYLDYDWSLNE